MEDIRLGRKIYWQSDDIDIVANVNKVVLGSNTKRVFAIIPSHSGWDLFLGFGKAGSATYGFRLCAGAPPLYLDIKTHGKLLQTAISVFQPANSFGMTVLAGYLDEE